MYTSTNHRLWREEIWYSIFNRRELFVRHPRVEVTTFSSLHQISVKYQGYNDFQHSTTNKRVVFVKSFHSSQRSILYALVLKPLEMRCAISIVILRIYLKDFMHSLLSRTRRWIEKAHLLYLDAILKCC